MIPVPSQFPTKAPYKAAADSPSAPTPATHLGDTAGVPVSWLEPVGNKSENRLFSLSQIYLAERVTEREYPSVIAMTRPGCCQRPGIPSRRPLWVTGTHVLEPSAACQVHEQEMEEPGFQVALKD